jgi:RNA polymerase sigma factor (sigma-70 family)
MGPAVRATASPVVGRWCGAIALDDGPDAAQETLTVVFQRLGQLRDPDALHGWVRQIAVRAAIRVARTRRAATPVAADWFADVPAADDPALRADVAAVLARLAPEQRAVLVLRAVDGLTETQIATVLDIPEGTVRSRMFRARHRFREEWQE